MRIRIFGLPLLLSGMEHYDFRIDGVLCRQEVRCAAAVVVRRDFANVRESGERAKPWDHSLRLRRNQCASLLTDKTIEIGGRISVSVRILKSLTLRTQQLLAAEIEQLSDRAGFRSPSGFGYPPYGTEPAPVRHLSTYTVVSTSRPTQARFVASVASTAGFRVNGPT
jgi:hypothetical protein